MKKKKHKTNDFSKRNLAKKYAARKKTSARDKTHALRRAVGNLLLTGKFLGTARGFGFFRADANFEIPNDIFIPERAASGAFSGDTVEVSVHKRDLAVRKDGSFHAEGEVVRILARGVTEFCGTLILDTRYLNRIFSPYRVISDDPRFTAEVEVENDRQIPEGHKVRVRILDYGKGRIPPKGEILEDLGNTFSLDANYRSILSASGIRTEFPDEVIGAAEAAAAEEISPHGRLDLRNDVIFTIDGEDAKDLDDAISLSKTASGYTLGVHIADVSHYVTSKSAIDKEAFARGTSVYFIDRVVPMLPRCLSNGACSLDAGTDKYTLSAMIDLDKNGALRTCRIENAIINSKVRGVYSEVNDLFSNGSKSKFYPKYKAVYQTLKTMHALYELLEARAKARGVLDLESAEARFILDGDGKPVDIAVRVRGDAEKMIEQFMLTANEAVARHLAERGLPGVYRVHEAPSEEKLTAYKNFVYNLGLPTASLHGDKLTTASFAPILEAAAEKGVGDILSRVTLRAQMKARYSEIRGDHFGLGLAYYCHFTSPIRRYPDLSVHRIIKYAMAYGIPAAQKRFTKFAAESAAASSENELRAMNAERDIEDLYKVIFMQDEVGKEFDAVIGSVTSFGLFCELENTCEGLIPIELLGEGFSYNEGSQTLSRGKTAFRLGQPVRVRITETNILRRRIYMALV
ncbi:MAG: ribonuclease R [Clostridia bacterium]|nr:ribonuclease R [Clostridia bacterium]